MSTSKKEYTAASNDEKEMETKEAAQTEEERVEEMSPQRQLFYQSKHGKDDELKKLAKSKLVININDRDEEGFKGDNCYISKNTALHYAVQSGSIETVKVIYGMESSLDGENKIKSTPLHIAASLGYTEIVDFLLEMKANVNVRNLIGNTPLHCAVYAGHVETVKVILKKFDDKTAALGGQSSINGIGMSPAKYTHHDEMKAYLRTFFPPAKKNKENINLGHDENDEMMNDGQTGSYGTNNNYGNNIQEEDDDSDDDDETAQLNT